MRVKKLVNQHILRKINYCAGLCCVLKPGAVYTYLSQQYGLHHRFWQLQF
jgi:hypothetical protein